MVGPPIGRSGKYFAPPIYPYRCVIHPRKQEIKSKEIKSKKIKRKKIKSKKIKSEKIKSKKINSKKILIPINKSWDSCRELENKIKMKSTISSES